MKRRGLLNPQLNGLIARLGHTERFVIADCGLPIPREVPVVDLAVVAGVPDFATVFEAIMAEVVVEHATIASDTPAAIRMLLPEEIGCSEISHEELKAVLPECAFVVRTGSTVPYANVILHAGVAF